MITLADFKNYGFSITWKLIDIGFMGSEIFRNEISVDSIIDYAMDSIFVDDKDVTELAISSSDQIFDINNCVKHLAYNEKSSYDIEWRKWRVIYVIKNLPTESVDYTEGLLDLTEIWVSLEFPVESPHIVQGINNNITPVQYYTEENYKILLQRHKQWIDKEIVALKGK